ncbi:MAG: LysR substrate-binding domain-containing protein [Pigmentiphaga sp.]|uniref:LysR family transcriptional regulator n=1 Tax=Pigmentiphaga sp. TaxID=1977564 RepID=UPI0029AFB9F2|nr:LysR substrate-binding domain-containing protein [Pigmentiphaga sp.]MDX3905964.1 LysR substrate-binding domain-containing protein [Pigmentiphaga sp.]
MDFRRLQYFIVLAEELSFTKAARRLNMSQPPLSQQIKMLEAELGALLFQRTKRSVNLTPAGRELYEQVKPWLADLTAIANRVRRISQGEEGQLHVTCSFSTAQALLPRLVKNYRECHPNIAVEVLEMPMGMQVDAIIKGIVDVGVMRLPVDQTYLTTMPLYDEALMVALPVSHPLASRKAVSLLDLKNEVFLKASRHSAALFESIEAICRRAGFQAKVAQVSSNLNTALGFVGVEMGIALIPESMHWARPDGVAYVALKNSPRSTVGAVWRRDNESPAVQLFVDAARELALENSLSA